MTAIYNLVYLFRVLLFVITPQGDVAIFVLSPFSSDGDYLLSDIFLKDLWRSCDLFPSQSTFSARSAAYPSESNPPARVRGTELRQGQAQRSL